MSFFVTNTTAARPAIPFEAIKNEILGTGYRLSLSLIGEKRARGINRRTRQKLYAPNVLSFPLDAKTGEVYLTPAVAKREAPSFDHSFTKHLTFLYIHGLLHLKGMDHGPAMERLEQKYLKRYA